MPSSAPAPTPLSTQLVHAARCVQAVAAGRSLSEALPQVPAGLRPGVQALAFHALRHLGQARALASLLAEHAPPAPALALLQVGVSLLLVAEDDAAAPRYEAFTVVDQAVDAARVLCPRQAGLVNACLRRLLREQAELLPQVAADWEARFNHPAWWVKRLRRDHPPQWQAILAASQQPAALVLRVNTLHMDRDTYLAHLRDAGIAAQPLAELGLPGVPDWADAVRLSQHQSVEALPGYAQGWFAVQDAAAQLAAPLLLEGKGQTARSALTPLRVLDACAAPGGKTAHLVAQARARGQDIRLLALEVDAQRARRIGENLLRLGCLDGEHPPVVQVADAGQPDTWWDGQPFDAILLDAPCTASGIVRRHPDVRWLRRDTDVASLAATQRQLLDTLWPLLRLGGRLVYATCSVFRAEGQAQAQAFQQRHSDAKVVPAPGHLWPCGPEGGASITDNPVREHDGFFYASWDKLPG